MKAATDTTKSAGVMAFDRSLGWFFRQAVGVSRRDPRLALVFARAAARQRKAAAKRREWGRKGVQVPPLMILSVTKRCNLRCAGCFVQAQDRSVDAEMSVTDIRRLLSQAVELGVSVVAIAGGEPLTRPELLDIAAEFPELMFLLITNGSLLDEAVLAKLERTRNLIPVLSLEGFESATDERRGLGVYARVTAAMDEMKRRNIFFGSSIMVTRRNFPLTTSRQFVRELVARGSRLFFYVDYVPVKTGTDLLVPSAAQRAAESLSVSLFRKEFPALFLAASASEETFGGCLAAGRGFVHVNPEGGLEPCPFSPYSDANVREVGLRRALQSRLLREIRESDVHLSESGGGCALWNNRSWMESLLAAEAEPAARPCCEERLVA